MWPRTVSPMREIRPEMQYATLAQQSETAQLGMWVFIATEVLFFGALLFAYFVYRTGYPQQFDLAGGDSKIVLGSINEAILLTGSLTMVAAIAYAKRDDDRTATRLLLLTALLGVAFLGVKGYEYFQDYEDHAIPALNYLLKPDYGPSTELFWVFYFVATGIHALHLTIGIVVVLIMAAKARRGDFSHNYSSPLEVTGLYWSFVDVVWLFLFAAIYPLGRGG